MNIESNTIQEEKNPQEEKVIKNTSQQASNDQVENEEDPSQINWRKFKEARKIEREESAQISKRAKEKEEEANALRLAMEQLLNKQQPQQRNYNNENEEEETEDQRIDKKVQAALRVAEQKRQQEQQQREHESFPERLNQNFSDFNEVCSTENLDYLEYHYPEVAEAFKGAPEGYNKWASVYKAVKRFVPNTDSKKDARKADKNFNKPQSSSMSGLANSDNSMPAMRLDEARKQSNWERMQRTLKGLS